MLFIPWDGVGVELGIDPLVFLLYVFGKNRRREAGYAKHDGEHQRKQAMGQGIPSISVFVRTSGIADA